MEDIAARAEARVQVLLDRARAGLGEAEKALAEAAKSPVFGNGIAKGLQDGHKTVEKLDGELQNLKVHIAQLFRGGDREG